MAREKGTPKTGGRTKGTPNKVTKDTREVLSEAISKNIDRVVYIMEQSDDKEFISIVLSILPYVIPKLQSTEVKAQIDHMGEKIQTVYDALQSQPDIPDSEPEQG